MVSPTNLSFLKAVISWKIVYVDCGCWQRSAAISDFASSVTKTQFSMSIGYRGASCGWFYIVDYTRPACLLQMINEMESDLQEARQQLQRWEKDNQRDIEEYEECQRIGQQLKLKNNIADSPFYLLSKLRKMKCEVCHFPGRYKYMRVVTMLSRQQHQKCLVFMLCDHCFKRQTFSSPIFIDRKCYVPMHTFLTRIRNGLSTFDANAEYSESLAKRYDFFVSRLAHTAHQLVKAVEKKNKLICSKLFDEVSILRDMFLSSRHKQVYSTLVKEQKCTCQDQCCYCDYNSSNNDYAKANCSYYGLKKEQDELITRTNLLGTLKSAMDREREQNILSGIVKELELVVINNISSIQKAVNAVIDETKNFSLLNQDFMRKIEKNGSSEEELGDQQQLITDETRKQYIQQGVLNHLTCEHFHQFSNEITTICLDYMPEEVVLRNKLKMFEKLSKIEVGCKEICTLLIEETIKAKHQEQASIVAPSPVEESKLENSIHNPKNIENSTKKSDQDLLNLNSFKQLTSISLNCRVPFKQQFFTSIDLPKISQMYLNWNHMQFFQKINQSSHFLQEKDVLNSFSPSSKDIRELYHIHQLKNIWIGNCGPSDSVIDEGNSEMVRVEACQYEQILQQMRSRLEGVMIGQFDGISRAISQNIYKEISNGKHLKSLFLNKINLDREAIIQVLQANQRLEALYFNQCEQIQSTVLQAVTKLPVLKKLSIVQIRWVSFSRGMPSLQTFILQRCYGLVGRQVITLLKDAKLSYLSLYECRFIYDEEIQEIVIQQIKNCAKLKSLNLGYSKVSDSTIDLLTRLQSLKSLHLGGTKISLPLLLQKFVQGKLNNLRGLQKISLREMKEISERKDIAGNTVSQYYNDLFSYILECLPQLSHLDLSNNKIINERAARFGLANLAYLNVADTMYTLSTENNRIDHSGGDCPFVKGRIGMREKDIQLGAKPQEKTLKKKVQDKKSQTNSLKVFY